MDLETLREFIVPILTAIGGIFVGLSKWWYDRKKIKAEEAKRKQEEKSSALDVYKMRAEDAEKREAEALEALKSVSPKLKEVYEKYTSIIERLGKAEIELSLHKNTIMEITNVVAKISEIIDSDEDEDVKIKIQQQIKHINTAIRNTKDAVLT